MLLISGYQTHPVRRTGATPLSDSPATNDATPTVRPRSAKKWRRLKVLVALGAVLVLLAAAYVHFWLYLPMGSGPAGPNVPAETFAKPWTERKVLLVGIGDSVTAGFGASPGLSYFERLTTNPENEFDDMQGRSLSRVLPNLEAQNISVSGSNSLEHVSQIEKKLPESPTDVFGMVVMTSGGNDLIHWYGRTPPREGAMYGCTQNEAKPWIANYEKRLDQMFSAIESRFPGGCLIFIADIYDPSDGYGNPESAYLPPWPECIAVHTAYNEAIHRAAAQHPETVRVVPMHGEFLGHGVHCRKFWTKHYRYNDPNYWYLFNLEDPNDRGYDAIRRVFLLEMIKERERIAAEGSPMTAGIGKIDDAAKSN